MASGHGIVRDCACPRARHKHGTHTAAVADNCGCGPCATALYRYRKALRHHGNRSRPQRTVSTIPTRRRVQALRAVGWSIVEIAARAGVPAKALYRTQSADDRCPARYAAAVAAVYEPMAATPPTGSAKAIAARIQAARAAGFPPPAAWDDIDDPDERPARPNTVDKRARIADRADEIRMVIATDSVDSAIRRLGYKSAISLIKSLHRAELHDLAAFVDRVTNPTKSA